MSITSKIASHPGLEPALMAGTAMVIDGNKAAAHAVRLCRAQLICAYPITPQTPLLEHLARFVTDGKLKATFIQAESEHSAMSIVAGGCMAGDRTFIATSSQGLAYMYEAYFWTSTTRLPVVMAVANREMQAPHTVAGGQQDTISVRDAGWIQLYVEDVQELLDTIIVAYRIAEDPEVLLPVNVCFDGYYLSHLTERVIVPHQEMVDQFVPPYQPPHIKIDPQHPISINTQVTGEMVLEYRHKHIQAMKNAKELIGKLDEQFQQLFGRSHGGLLQTYRGQDADIVLLTLGSVTGTARVAVDMARAKGLKVGLIKLRSFRPFPREALAQALYGKSVVGVIERDVCFSWGMGTLHMELLAALRSLDVSPQVIGFVGGLGGADIPLKVVCCAVDTLGAAATGQKVPGTVYMGME